MAMEDSGSMMSPADIAALTKGNSFGDGSGLSWLVLIILFFGFMGGGFGWNRNGELECCDYDMIYLTEIQDKYHKKFKD